MSDEQIGFERAEFEQPAAAALGCSGCDAPLERYHTVNGRPLCDPCLGDASSAHEGSFIKAMMLGAAAAVVGALAYYGIRAVTGLELGLVAIVVGVIVGMGVRMGAGGRRSVVYRLMAVGLAYASITSTYVPMVVEGLVSDSVVGGAQTTADADGVPEATEDLEASGEPVEGMDDGPAVYILGAMIALVMPGLFLADGEFMMVIILAIGLWEAWSLSRPGDHEVLGPFSTTGPSQPSQPPPKPEGDPDNEEEAVADASHDDAQTTEPSDEPNQVGKPGTPT